jgi:hypothetical protein
VQGVTIEDCQIGDGFVVFYRRLPPEMRDRRRNPARRFDMRVRQLEAA